MLADLKLSEPYISWLTRAEPVFRYFRKIPQRRWILLCQIILVIFLARQLALFTWQLVPVETSEPAWQINHLASGNTQHNNPYAQLNKLHLFGIPPQQEETKQPTPERVPVSRLAARITGIVASSEPSHSLAIIKVGGSDKTYHIGETLKGTRAKVHEIYPDRVILLNGEQFESLLMYPDEAGKKPRPVARYQSKSVKQAIARVRSNPASLSEIVSISPMRKNGELQGYRINPTGNPALFKKLGLKPGDLAVAINGHDLTDQSQAMKILTSLPELNQISLTVEREGQQYQIDIPAS
ncbi:type II secretion system protein GspC [Endozoicomonas sp. Mp262]|uniref:type II secretion system protein GspC n=1 Tax=Endozoicomonas sp. Mp262 TaxID=2919499 RepID=UPI0021DB67BB